MKNTAHKTVKCASSHGDKFEISLPAPGTLVTSAVTGRTYTVLGVNPLSTRKAFVITLARQGRTVTLTPREFSSLHPINGVWQRRWRIINGNM